MRIGEPLAEAVVVGLAVLVFSLPIVTAPAAMAAGVTRLRAGHAGERSGFRDYVATFVRASRVLSWFGVAVVVIEVILLLNLYWLGAAAIPGGQMLVPVTIAAGFAVVLCALWVAAVWRDDVPLLALLRRAWQVAGVGPLAALASATLLIGVLVWFVPPLIVVAPGMLAYATFVVGSRAYQPEG